MIYLTVDPGESTGWSLWNDHLLTEVGTEELDPFVAAWGEARLSLSTQFDTDPELVKAMRPVEYLIVEDWALYPWKLQSLAWDKCRTARAIGALTYIADAATVPYALQPASIKDAAVAAGAEAYFRRPRDENRHLNDAIMHGVYAHTVGTLANSVGNRTTGIDGGSPA